MAGRLFAASIAVLLLGTSPSTAPTRAQEGGGASKANLDLPFDAEGEDQEEEEAPEIIVFYGQQYEGDGIFFCCDKSGSMEGAPWKRLQQEVTKNVTQFSERVQFGIVFFDGDVLKYPTSGRPAEASPPLKAGAIAMVLSSQIGHGRGSCYKKGLVAALTYANLSSSKRKLIICLGDGKATCGGADRSQYGTETLNEVKNRNSTGVKINTLCLGQDVDEDFMRKLAAQNGGQYSRIVR